ncbi:MAG: hypothetical protein CMJ76_08905 [Planctomycetaceae bacterium]|nr:hypothetical protein [Planctomycetaceae bacterium]
MSENSRRQQIESMLSNEPDDPFLQYALAMELEKEGEHQQSLEWLERLTLSVPPYVPAFFMAGQQLTRLDRLEEARDWLTRGIAQAQEQGNLHAAGEMNEFLAMISD